MRRWLAIVGIGEDGLDGLDPRARALIERAEVLVGGSRHLAMIPADGRERLTWRAPLAATVAEIDDRRGTAVCVLATGDPMFFGIGVTLARRFPLNEMTILPAVSAASLACARLGWPRAEVETVTLHGRPLDLIQPLIQPGARLLALANDGATPAEVAALLRARGFGPSRVWVFEHMGGPRERVFTGGAARWRRARVADFNTLAIDCRAAPGTEPLPRAPGLPDSAYRHDGQLTKRETRAITLAALAPRHDGLLWDVGAGCGSVAIEWMRAERGARAIAVERDPARAILIADNARTLGVPGLEIVVGAAPGALAGLAPPDAVFIGGGIGDDAVFDACWRALRPGGRLVANVVTVEGETALAGWRARVGGDLTRVNITRAAPLGDLTGWRPMMPITQFTARKR